MRGDGWGGTPVSYKLLAVKRATVPALVLIACLVSAGLGLQLGRMRQALTSPSEYVMLPITFDYWDSAPVSRHLGLSFVVPEDLPQGRAYQHLTQAWLGLAYVLMKPLTWFGVPYATGQNVLAFFTFGVMLWMVSAAVSLSQRPSPADPWATWALWFPLVVLGFSIVATLPSLWVASIIGNPEDQHRFLAAIGVAYISVLDFHRRPLGRAGFLTAVGVALVAPMYAACLFITLAFLATPLGGSRFAGLQWERWRSQGLIFGLVIALGIAVPYVMLWIGGWQGVGSSVFFRAGLDGGTQYFTDMFQSVINPYDAGGRDWRLYPLIAAATLVAAATFALSRPLAVRMFRQLFFCWSMALLWIVVFPQAVSIHPYLFDFGLLFPAAFCIAFWVVQPEVQDVLMERRPIALMMFIVLTGLLVTNYIDLART